MQSDHNKQLIILTLITLSGFHFTNNFYRMIGKWPGDHECRQIGSVDGEKDEGKRCPDVGHETGGRTPRAIHVDCSLESRVGKVFAWMVYFRFMK